MGFYKRKIEVLGSFKHAAVQKNKKIKKKEKYENGNLH